MTIACLAWGSLEWNPGDLKVQLPWRTDGPLLPVEYVRQSLKKHLTLVLTDLGTTVTTLWAPMTSDNLTGAIESLRAREGTNSASIGRWPSATEYPFAQTVEKWAKSKGLEAVVWTALPPKFAGRDGVAPTVEEAIAHLSALDVEAKKVAEEYVRKTPATVRTAYRARFETDLGWVPITSAT